MSKIYKNYSPKIFIILLFQISLLTFSVFLINNNFSTFYIKGDASFNHDESLNSAYITHSPICILNDADFAPFPGTGTPGDPKIIENYEIITDSDSLIYIRDTTLHFVIRDNHLAYTTAYDMDGIGLLNVKNGVIENNTIEHAQHGIFLIDSENVSIYKNQIVDSYASGIRLLCIDGKVNVTYNTIDNVDYHGNGIWLDQHCQELKIEHNTVYNIPFGNGIFIDGRDWTTPVDPYPIPPPPAPNYQIGHEISHNEVFDCQNGIMFFVDNKTLETYSENSIFNNYLHNNSQHGFCTNHHFQIEFYNNILSNNDDHGAYFDDGLYNTQFFNNTFTFNEDGILINSFNYPNQNNDFIDNFFENNSGNAIKLTGATFNNDFINNSFLNNNFGIYISGNNNKIIDNKISESNTGIFLSGSVIGNKIFNNTINESNYGIHFKGPATSNEIIDNDLKNLLNGIFFEKEAVMNVISKNSIENSNQSLNFQSNSNQNNISLNLIRKNTYGILFNLNGTENYINNNTIITNTFYGLFFDTATNNCHIHWNTFIGNNEGLGTQVYDNGTLNQIIFNYYDDWTQPDDNSDGFVDYPYMIDGEVGNFDPFPLADPVSVVDEHYLTQVILLYPNGGEMINDYVLIIWTESVDSWHFTVTYSLFSSWNGGSDWTEIATDLEETSYLWDTVNQPKSSTYLIRVNATSTGNLNNTDESDGFFTLTTHTLTPPTVLAPNGGELVNDSILISWVESFDSWNYSFTYSIEVSCDGGANWIEIASGLTETSYLWNTISEPKSSLYLVRINATSEDDLISSDESDGLFTLTAHTLTPPTVLAPNGGELVNDSILISWVESFDSWNYSFTYSIEVSCDGGANWIEIASGLTETSYLWNTISEPKSSLYLVRINATSEDDLMSSDESDDTFCLNPHTLSLPTITYPSGGETLVGMIPIIWEECFDSWCCSVCYSIYYSDDNGTNWIQLATSLTHLSYNWNTTLVEDGDLYVLKVISYGGYNIQQEFVSEVFSIDNVEESGSSEPDPLLFALTIGGIIVGSVAVAGGVYYTMRKRSKRVPPEN